MAILNRQLPSPSPQLLQDPYWPPQSQDQLVQLTCYLNRVGHEGLRQLHDQQASVVRRFVRWSTAYRMDRDIIIRAVPSILDFLYLVTVFPYQRLDIEVSLCLRPRCEALIAAIGNFAEVVLPPQTVPLVPEQCNLCAMFAIQIGRLPLCPTSEIYNFEFAAVCAEQEFPHLPPPGLPGAAMHMPFIIMDVNRRAWCALHFDVAECACTQCEGVRGWRESSGNLS